MASSSFRGDLLYSDTEYDEEDEYFDPLEGIRQGDNVSLTHNETENTEVYEIDEINNDRSLTIRNKRVRSYLVYDENYHRWKVEGDTNEYTTIFMSNPTVRPTDLTNYKVVVFDFDCTITKKHTCARKGHGDLTSDEASGLDGLDEYVGRLNAIRFRDLVYLLESAQVIVAIASFGSKPVISAMLRLILGHKRENLVEVVTPGDIEKKNPNDRIWRDCHKPPPEYSKNDMLLLIKKRFNIQKNELILLIDDDSSNIEKAKREGYSGYAVTPCIGFEGVYHNLSRDFS